MIRARTHLPFFFAKNIFVATQRYTAHALPASFLQTLEADNVLKSSFNPDMLKYAPDFQHPFLWPASCDVDVTLVPGPR